MSSAAKLRRFGRGTAVVATAAMVMTAFGPAAFASWDDAPQTSFVDSTQTIGRIGVVDTGAAADNQGATLVHAGQTGQAIGDIRLTLPNRFASGDILDLKLLDRSATENSDGLANQDAATLVGFSGVEGVTIEVSQAMDPRTTIQADTDAVDTATPRTSGNTETSMLSWTAGTNTSTNPLATTAPGTTPAFNAPSVFATAGNQGKDNLRLQVNNRSTGDPNAVWVVTIKGLKVDLGAKATPGELRVVPFLSNVGPTAGVYTASPWFCGNTKEDNNGTAADTSDDTPREIGIYTVPAYVSPVTVKADTQQIIADGSRQSVGDVTIAETQPFSLQNGTYTVDFSQSGSDVTIASTTAEIKAALSGGGTSESVSNIAVAPDRKSFSFTLGGADNTRSSTITFSGLLLQASRTGTIALNITGGSMSGTADSWLASPAGTSTLAIDNPVGADIYPSVALLNPAPGATTGEVGRVINQTLAVSASTNPATAGAPAAPVITAADGMDVLPAGAYTVSSNGNTIAGPGGVVLTRTTGDTFTGTVTGAGAATDTYTITNVTAGLGSFTLGAPEYPTGTTPALGAAGALPIDPTYLYVDVDTSDSVTGGDTVTGGGLVLTRTTEANEWLGNNGVTYTISDATAAAGFAVANGAVSAPTAAGVVTVGDGAGASTPANLPEADYTVSADGNTITGGGVTLQRVGSGTTFRISSTGGVAGLTVGDEFAFTGTQPNLQFHITGGVVDAVYGSRVTIDGVQHLGAGDYTVTQRAPGVFDIGGDATLNGVRNGVQVDADTTADGIQGVTFYGLAAGQTFTVEAGQLLGNLDDCGFFQTDIQAPVDEFTQFGTASAGVTAIGGTDRFGTARKIAREYSMYGDTAIIANGLNFPDSLSAGFLSQREGAPILLTLPTSLPQDTIESLKERGVRKVYVVGGSAAVGQAVVDQLRRTPGWMYDQAAGALKPRGENLEVLQLGGQDRYHTNWVVNTYAAAQTVDAAPVGKIAVAYGQPLKTTAMIALGTNFPDALSANLLTAGRAGEFVDVTTGARGVVTLTRNPAGGASISVSDLQKFTKAGDYYVVVNDLRYGAVDGPVVATRSAADSAVWSDVTTAAAGVDADALNGSITFSAALADGTNFQVAISEDTRATRWYDPTASRVNALPVILTPGSDLHKYAENQLEALHIEHALFIGGADVLTDTVMKAVDGKDVTTMRLAGDDRYGTAAAVARFAMAPAVATQDGGDPGLGFDGRRQYYTDNTPVPNSGEFVSYVANGIKFPDALVAGPWISYARDVMVMTLPNELPEATKAFLTEKAPVLDRAAALGLGNAVGSKVIEEANRIVSSR